MQGDELCTREDGLRCLMRLKSIAVEQGRGRHSENRGCGRNTTNSDETITSPGNFSGLDWKCRRLHAMAIQPQE